MMNNVEKYMEFEKQYLKKGIFWAYFNYYGIYFATLRYYIQT